VLGEGPVINAGLQSVLEPLIGRHIRLITRAESHPLDDILAGGDVVLVDPSQHEPAWWSRLTTRAAEQAVAVVAYVSTFEPSLVAEAVAGRVSGIVLKRSSPQVLIEVLDGAARGHFAVDPAVSGRLAASAIDLRRESWPGSDFGLTRREGEIFVAVGEGLRNDEIADRLSISIQTVRTHLRAVYRKVGVHDRSSAVALAWRLGVVSGSRTPTA
jgi:DNA-binding NarL/FixJ family response regulator